MHIEVALLLSSVVYRRGQFALESGTRPRAHKNWGGGGGGGGGRACNCTSWLWSRRNGRLVPKYTYHSLSARCTSGWLAIYELITHTRAVGPMGFILNLGTSSPIPPGMHAPLVTRSSSLCALGIADTISHCSAWRTRSRYVLV